MESIPSAAAPSRDLATIERMVRRGTLNARVAFWMLGGLGALLIGLIAWETGSAAAVFGGAIGMVIGGVPMWGPLYLHLRRMRRAVRAAATSGESLTGTVTDVSVYVVRGSPVTRVRFDLVSSLGARFRGALDLGGRRTVEIGSPVPVLFHPEHPTYCLAGEGPGDPYPARLTPSAEAAPRRVALRIALAVLVGGGFFAAFMFFTTR